MVTMSTGLSLATIHGWSLSKLKANNTFLDGNLEEGI